MPLDKKKKLKIVKNLQTKLMRYTLRSFCRRAQITENTPDLNKIKTEHTKNFEQQAKR